MSEKLTKQEIYDRIKTSSKDSYILEEMQRLGFWESTSEPSLSELLIKQETEINKELGDLLAQDKKFANREGMVAEMRKERMKIAKAKRIETQLNREKKQEEKAQKWQLMQQEHILYLGQSVSKGLNNNTHDVERLEKFNLPFFEDALALAKGMQIDLKTLQYLAYDREVSKINHYHSFEVAKKSGGKRKISAPKTKLKEAQTWVLEQILSKIPVSDQAHGFIKQRSIVSNAQAHLNKDVVVNIDLKDFFPTITYKRVKGLFCKLGYSEQVSTILSLLCTHPETETIALDGQTYFVQTGARTLPQGSPASPAISNMMVYKMDKKISGLAKKYGFDYSRYADDMTFSTLANNQSNVSRLLFYTKKIVASEGFVIHPDKIHVMTKGNQQKVTGVVVNDKLNVERLQLRKFRALLHNIETQGWKDQKWGKAIHLINAIEGYINFVQMVNPQKGQVFKQKLKEIIGKHGRPQQEKILMPLAPTIVPPVVENGIEKPTESKPENWWNIF